MQRTRSDLLAAVLWSSRDGKGRTHYPMVLAASATGPSPAFFIQSVFPALTSLRATCEAAPDAPGVRAALDAARNGLNASAAGEPVAALDPDPAALAALAARPELAGDRLFRVLYHLDREAGAYVRGTLDGSTKTKWAKLRPSHLRLPVCDDDRPAAMLRWARALLVWLDPSTPLTLIAPAGQPWIDAIVGHAEGSQAFCLRAGIATLPLVTDIPYTMDDAFLTRARALLPSTPPSTSSTLARALLPLALASIVACRASAEGAGVQPATELPAIADAPSLDTGAVCDLVVDPRTPPSGVIGFWRSLVNRPGEFWPATPEHLAQEARMRPRVDEAAGRISPDLLAAVTDERRARLISFLAAATTPEMLDPGLAAVEPLGFTARDLDPRMAYNLRLRRFKTEALRPDLPLPDQQSQRLAREFAADARAMQGGLAFMRPAATLLAGIDALERPPVPTPAAAPAIPAVGPGGVGGGLFTMTADGPRVRFSPRSGSGPVLEFVRIEPSPPDPGTPLGDPAIYMGVDEVSLETGVAIAKLRSSPAELGLLLPRLSGSDDSRHGPRVWHWPIRAGPSAWPTPAPAWLPRTAALAAPTYAEGSAPEPPTGAHPLQQISPQAAGYLAALIGCRLPSFSEWARAVAQFPEAANPEKANLRDQTWLAHAKYVQTQSKQLFPPPPADDGSYAPTGGPQARENTDGLLWFAPVGGSGQGAPRNLVGNVAEYVLDSPDEKGAAAVLPPDPAGVQGAFQRGRVKVGVVGGSAISDPALRVGEVRWLPADQQDAESGFADVGFRLAFTAAPGVGLGMGPAERPSVQARLRTLLEPTPYIWAR